MLKMDALSERSHRVFCRAVQCAAHDLRRGKGREFVEESGENAAPYRRSFILLDERTAFPPLQRTLQIHSFRAPHSGGEIPENPHCSFSVEEIGRASCRE